MTKSIKLNASNIIGIKKSIDAEITKYSHIIRGENVISIKAAKAGMGSGKDLKALYNTIQQLRNKRIMIKGMLQYLNIGLTTFDYDAFKKTNYYAIFAACEAKEDITLLKMIPTINPTTKAKKGANGTGKKETFTSAKIAQLIHDQQLIANKYDAALEKFNSESSIEIRSTIDNIKEYIAA